MDSAVVESSTGQYPDPTTVLPDELVCGTFRLLNFAGRIAASHVSPSWRRIALSDRRLWADYSRNRPKPDVLSALLARSDPLPFRLECKSAVPDGISKLVRAHMERMEALHLVRFESDAALQRIFEQDIPVLKSFKATHGLHGDKPMEISPRWASAPRLETFDLSCPCIWPADSTDSGCAPEGGMPVSKMFPNLTSLSLSGVTETSLPPPAQLPPRLTTLKLWSDETIGGVDCTTFLRDCTAPYLRALVIQKTHNASCAFEAIRLFKRLVDEPRTLSIDNGIVRVWGPPSDPPPPHYYVKCTDPLLPSSIAEIVPDCGKLVDLDLPLEALLSLRASNASLPALAAITINLIDLTNSDMAASLQGMAAAPPARQERWAPVLRLLYIRTGLRAEKPVGALLDRIVRAVRPPGLAIIGVVIHKSDLLEKDEIVAFLAYAARVEIRASAGEILHVVGEAEVS